MNNPVDYFSNFRVKKKSIVGVYGTHPSHENILHAVLDSAPLCRSLELSQTKDWICSSLGRLPAVRLRRKDVSAPLDTNFSKSIPDKSDIFAFPILMSCCICLVLSTASEHTTQALVPGLKLPVLVTMAQLVISALGSALFLGVSDALGYTKGAALDEIIWFSSSRRRVVAIFAIAVCDAVGFLAANLSLGLDNLTFHHCTFAAEPLFTSVLLFFFQGRRRSFVEYASILPIVFGIYLCTASSMRCSTAGFLLAAVSNFCFAMRSILASAILQTGQAGAGPADARSAPRHIGSFRLFVLVSFGGSTVMTCVYFTTELHTAWRAALYTTEVMGWTSRPAAMATVSDAYAWGVVDDQDPVRILGQLLAAGTIHLLYNAASFQASPLPASPPPAPPRPFQMRA
jgi:hypothetical protein